jgi:hypothetical protein
MSKIMLNLLRSSKAIVGRLQPDFAQFGTGGESAERLQAIVDAQSTQGLTISI